MGNPLTDAENAAGQWIQNVENGISSYLQSHAQPAPASTGAPPHTGAPPVNGSSPGNSTPGANSGDGSSQTQTQRPWWFKFIPGMGTNNGASSGDGSSKNGASGGFNLGTLLKDGAALLLAGLLLIASLLLGGITGAANLMGSLFSGGIGGALSDVGSALGSAWDGIKGMIAAPGTTIAKAAAGAARAGEHLAQGIQHTVSTAWDHSLSTALAWVKNLTPEQLNKPQTMAESAGNTNAVSPTGALGLMQLEPGTAADVAKELGYHMTQAQINARLTADPEFNKQLGLRYMHDMRDHYNGDSVLALAAYNAGPGTVDNHLAAVGDPRKGTISYEKFLQGMPTETRNYVAEIATNAAKAAASQAGGNLPGVDVASVDGPSMQHTVSGHTTDTRPAVG